MLSKGKKTCDDNAVVRVLMFVVRDLLRAPRFYDCIHILLIAAAKP